ncbi:hypothetical protein JKP88DRAFT_284675 [Tribonema minus]|uniref:Uncharacterized protein n=1 Tax=Tribonema minus TaxID=303371 RepID=A0A836CNV7_9STRA|nr:hypothetical protein JKP88DRAFT_284675 [Tribonema minus]
MAPQDNSSSTDSCKGATAYTPEQILDATGAPAWPPGDPAATNLSAGDSNTTPTALYPSTTPAATLPNPQSLRERGGEVRHAQLSTADLQYAIATEVSAQLRTLDSRLVAACAETIGDTLWDRCGDTKVALLPTRAVMPDALVQLFGAAEQARQPHVLAVHAATATASATAQQQARPPVNRNADAVRGGASGDAARNGGASSDAARGAGGSRAAHSSSGSSGAAHSSGGSSGAARCSSGGGGGGGSGGIPSSSERSGSGGGRGAPAAAAAPAAVWPGYPAGLPTEAWFDAQGRAITRMAIRLRANDLPRTCITGSSLAPLNNLRRMLPSLITEKANHKRQKPRDGPMWPVLISSDDFGAAWFSTTVFAVVNRVVNGGGNYLVSSLSAQAAECVSESERLVLSDTARLEWLFARISQFLELNRPAELAADLVRWVVATGFPLKHFVHEFSTAAAEVISADSRHDNFVLSALLEALRKQADLAIYTAAAREDDRDMYPPDLKAYAHWSAPRTADSDSVYNSDSGCSHGSDDFNSDIDADYYSDYTHDSEAPSATASGAAAGSGELAPPFVPASSLAPAQHPRLRRGARDEDPKAAGFPPATPYSAAALMPREPAAPARGMTARRVNFKFAHSAGTEGTPNQGGRTSGYGRGGAYNFKRYYFKRSNSNYISGTSAHSTRVMDCSMAAQAPASFSARSARAAACAAAAHPSAHCSHVATPVAAAPTSAPSTARSVHASARGLAAPALTTSHARNACFSRPCRSSVCAGVSRDAHHALAMCGIDVAMRAPSAASIAPIIDSEGALSGADASGFERRRMRLPYSGSGWALVAHAAHLSTPSSPTLAPIGYPFPNAGPTTFHIHNFRRKNRALIKRNAGGVLA